MRVKLLDISPKLAVSITGTEEWLTAIYRSFTTGSENEPPRLVGNLMLEEIGDGTAVSVKGEIEYAPVIACDRCNDPLIWPLKFGVDVYFQREPEQTSKVKQLSQGELDQYYYKDNDEIDLEELINDQLHMQLPPRVTCELQTGTQCLPELELDAKERDAAESPFAVLANLEIKDN